MATGGAAKTHTDDALWKGVQPLMSSREEAVRGACSYATYWTYSVAISNLGYLRGGRILGNS